MIEILRGYFHHTVCRLQLIRCHRVPLLRMPNAVADVQCGVPSPS